MKTFTALALLLATGASLVGSAPVKARVGGVQLQARQPTSTIHSVPDITVSRKKAKKTSGPGGDGGGKSFAAGAATAALIGFL